MKASLKRAQTKVPGKGYNGAVLAPHNLPAQMRLLVQLLTRRFQDVIAPYHITPLHWGILSCLWREDGLTTRAIVDQLDQLGGTVTVGLDSMEKRRLVERRVDETDRRISRIWLTKRGANLETKVVPLVRDFMAKIFSCVSEKEERELAALVDRLRRHIETMD